MNIPVYSSLHSFAANNVFNTPVKQTIGRIAAGFGAAGTVAAGYLYANFPQAVITAAINTGTTCLQTAANSTLANATVTVVENGCKSTLGELAVETLKATAIVGVTVFCAVKALKAGNNTQKQKEV